MVDILPSAPGRIVPALSATSDTPGVEPQASPPAKAIEPSPVAPPVAAPGVAGDADATAAPETPTPSRLSPEEAAQETPQEAAQEGDKADGEQGDAGEPERKPRPSINERFSEYARRTREANERADKLAAIAEQAVAALQRFTPQQEAQRQQEPPPSEPRPLRQTFEDPDSFEVALIEWAARNSAGHAAQVAAAEFAARQQAERETNERQRAEMEARERQDAMLTMWNERVAKAVEQFPDFEEVAKRDDVPISYAMRDAILVDENGPRVAYHLGEHPEEAERISKLPPVQQFVAIGRLSAQLAEPAPPPVTRMPAPPKPIGSNNAATRRAAHELSTDEYAERRMKQLQSERRAGMFGMRGGG